MKYQYTKVMNVADIRKDDNYITSIKNIKSVVGF